MLENPLVPPNLLLQAHVKSQANDMTLNTDLELPVKKRRENLPLKKRFQSVDDNNFTDKVHFAAHFKRKDEADGKISDGADVGVSEKFSIDVPMDFSLPTRIRAIFKNEPKSPIITDYKSMDYFSDKDSKCKDIAQNSIFAVNSSLLQFPLPFSLGSSPLANLFAPGLSSINLPLPINFQYNFHASNLMPNHLQTFSMHTSPDKHDSSTGKVSKKHKTKNGHVTLQNVHHGITKPTVSEPESSTLETYVINPATGNRVRRCYKNMTTERRMEANARERTRVHTIGAAFDRLRKLVPSLAPDQKLSKLSILRISCSYIMLLAAMNDLDYSADSQGYTVEECTDMLTETISSEAKFKR